MKYYSKMKWITVLCFVSLFLFACSKNDADTKIDYDIHARLEEVRVVAEPIQKQITEDGFLKQVALNDLSYQVYVMWDDVLNEIIEIIHDNLKGEALDQFIEEQNAWESEMKEETEAYVSQFAGGSITPMLANIKMRELTQMRAYELTKYFVNP